ncbi:YhgE/Pip family protein [Halalkalibacter sp. AB-rgal2]|uniref:YhgE/Pip family protein n=1 Tax=Halalkalibacter sp. AB-rgal2 TaxID=3242695 RepID=UPI00359CD694
MRNAWYIFKQDIKNIQRVPLVGILLIGLAILPSLYAWFNLGAAWDPYANTEGVQVAVVNQDQGTTIYNKDVNVGEELVDSLKSNENLGWVFVSRTEAERGVEYGEYYASIFISDTFSEDLVKIVEGEPRQAKVHYQVNEKVNAIAPKMTTTGASTIVNEMNDQFIQETSKVLFQELDKLGIRLEEELPTFRRLKNIVYEIEEHFPEVNELGEWIIEIDENWYQIEEQEAILVIEDSLSLFHKGINHILFLEEQFPRVNELADHIVDLEAVIPEIEKAVEELTEMNQSFSNVEAYVEEVLLAIQEARESIDEIEKRVPKSVDFEESIESFYQAWKELEGPLIETIEQHNRLINQTAQSINEMASWLAEENNENVIDMLDFLSRELTYHQQTIDRTMDMYSTLYETTGDPRFLEMVERYEQMGETLHQLNELVEEANAQVEEGEWLTSGQVQNIQELSIQIESMTSDIQERIDEEGLFEAFEKIEQDLSVQQMDAIHDAFALASDMALASEEKLEQLLKKLPSIEDTVNDLTEQIESNLPVAVERIEALSTFGLEELPNIEQQVTSVANWIRYEAPKVEENYSSFTKTLEEKIPAVEEAMRKLALFSREQLPETEQLLTDVANQIREIDENGYVNDIIRMLRNDLDEETEFFASPVFLEEEELFSIPNYGSANVPFYTTLSLWVGALLLSNLITTNLQGADRRNEFSLRDIYAGRMILFLLVAVLQGIIVSVGNLLLLGIYAAHPVWLIVFSVFIALVFMTIVYTLASILGNIGKALAIVLLVLQLSSGGGTFPIEVAPPFFQAIHPYMPFSYAINLLREAVGGIIPLLVLKNSLILHLFWLLALIIGFVLKPVLALRIEQTSQKSKSSRLVE